MNLPTRKQQEIYDAVVCRGEKIKDVALAFGVSPSTVRRAMDAVTDFDCETFDLRFNGKQVKTIIGWLRNGNYSANKLADHITATVEG